MDLIAEQEPDEIVISTPGPVGLLGYAAARLLGLKCTGIYHTDFTRQADLFIGDAWVSSAIETYTRWFFRQMDEVRVPTAEYMRMLGERGLERGRMRLFRRGIDASFVAENRGRQEELRKAFHIPKGPPTLVWAGRLGKEKNLDFLLDVHADVLCERPDVALVIAGDGPELQPLQRRACGDARIIFTGRLDREDLPHLYALADLLVFPSTTDTFGMVVLEAQACGLPAIVTDVGGPQEIVRNGETGFVVRADDRRAWTSAVLGVLEMKEQDPGDFRAMCRRAKAAATDGYGWESVLDEMLGTVPERDSTHDRDERSEPALLDLPA
jgi:glycosyltransferase involved in cell wall biosynthesis